MNFKIINGAGRLIMATAAILTTCSSCDKQPIKTPSIYNQWDVSKTINAFDDLRTEFPQGATFHVMDRCTKIDDENIITLNFHGSQNYGSINNLFGNNADYNFYWTRNEFQLQTSRQNDRTINAEGKFDGYELFIESFILPKHAKGDLSQLETCNIRSVLITPLQQNGPISGGN